MLPYRLVRHPRSRRLKLRVERDGALVVTAPPGSRRAEIDRFVHASRDWVAGVRQDLARSRAGRDPAVFGLRPTRIELPAAGERWRVVYGDGEAENRAFVLKLPAGEPVEATARRLQAWLKQRARRVLTPRIAELARSHGFEYRQLSFRNQRSRWGSCSSRGNLSLNAKLLLCSPGACRYVLIHELVHLEHPNHSPRFWRRVEALCPDYRQQKRELAGASKRLPDWVTAG